MNNIYTEDIIIIGEKVKNNSFGTKLDQVNDFVENLILKGCNITNIYAADDDIINDLMIKKLISHKYPNIKFDFVVPKGKVDDYSLLTKNLLYEKTNQKLK